MTSSVYLHHAGCSKVSRQTLEVLNRHQELEATIGVYDADIRVADEKQLFDALASEVIGAEPCDIAYTDSHTTGWERSLQLVTVGPGDVLLTSRSEWGGNLMALHEL